MQGGFAVPSTVLRARTWQLMLELLPCAGALAQTGTLEHGQEVHRPLQGPSPSSPLFLYSLGVDLWFPKYFLPLSLCLHCSFPQHSLPSIFIHIPIWQSCIGFLPLILCQALVKALRIQL